MQLKSALRLMALLRRLCRQCDLRLYLCPLVLQRFQNVLWCPTAGWNKRLVDLPQFTDINIFKGVHESSLAVVPLGAGSCWTFCSDLT